MRVTSKGQVTIPKDIRKRLGIEPGSEVHFIVDGSDVRLVAIEDEDTVDRRAAAIEAALDRMAGTGSFRLKTTDEWMEELRGPREDFDPR